MPEKYDGSPQPRNCATTNEENSSKKRPIFKQKRDTKRVVENLEAFSARTCITGDRFNSELRISPRMTTENTTTPIIAPPKGRRPPGPHKSQSINQCTNPLVNPSINPSNNLRKP